MIRDRLPHTRKDWLLTIGVAAIAAGFVLIALAWNGAASHDLIQQQFPYILSGGLGGIALVFVGSALVVLQSFRRDHDRVSEELAELRDALVRAVGEVVSNAAAPAAATARPSDEGLVLAGSASYHRPECRLAPKGENDFVPLGEAQSRGLKPCRVCRPDKDPGEG